MNKIKTITLISNNNGNYDLNEIAKGFKAELAQIFNEKALNGLKIEVEKKDIKTKILNKTILTQVSDKLILKINEEQSSLEFIVKDEFKKYINENITKLF